MAFDAGARIGIIAVTGGDVRLLPAATGDDGDPAFSPDGRRIFFTGANDRGGTDLYVRAADGSGAARLLINDAAQPAVSARGALAYARGGNIYMRPPGHAQRRFVTSGVAPDWSPDGRRLALIRPLANLTFDAPIAHIYTVRRDGRGLTQVGRQRYASNPAWSPNGRLIAYDGFDLGVYVKRVGVAAPAREWATTQIGDEGGFVTASGPAWRPLPR
jgi:Tol biopolymer transport system component